VEGYHAFTQVQFRYQNKDFQHGRFTSNSLRDGKNWLAGITQYILFAENTGNVRLGYTFDTDRTGGAPRPPSEANTPTPTGLCRPSPLRRRRIAGAHDFFGSSPKMFMQVGAVEHSSGRWRR
jgi:hypothetical protein